MQIVFGDQHGLCEGAVMIQDSHDGPFGAMRRQATATNNADSAGTVDLPDNSLPHISAGPRDAHEFVSEYSSKAHVSATQLQICFTNAGFQNIDGHFVRSSVAQLSRSRELQCTIKDYCSHRSHSEPGKLWHPQQPSPSRDREGVGQVSALPPTASTRTRHCCFTNSCQAQR